MSKEDINKCIINAYKLSIQEKIKSNIYKDLYEKQLKETEHKIKSLRDMVMDCLGLPLHSKVIVMSMIEFKFQEYFKDVKE